MPCASANSAARARSRAATATRRVPVSSAGATMARSDMRAAPRTPRRSGSVITVTLLGLGDRDIDGVGRGQRSTLAAVDLYPLQGLRLHWGERRGEVASLR